MRTKGWGSALAVAALSLWVGVAAAAANTTKAQYIAKADAICRVIEAQVNPLQAKLDAANTNTAGGLAKAAGITRQMVVLEKAGIRKLRALPKPSADAAVLTKVWNAAGGGVLAIAALSSALNQLNRPGMTSALDRLKLTDERYTGLAQGYGFKVCGAQR